MKALCWFGKEDVRYTTVENPRVIDPDDAVIKVSLTAICGSDLHLYDGAMPSMREGDILGHEAMDEVVEAGPAVRTLKKGDRIVVPFPIACGQCFFCRKGLFAACDTTNPNKKDAARVMGESPVAIYGYSHLLPLSGGPDGYRMFRDKQDGCIKVVMRP
jgi:threonine dehydrogenase-like Zn-dependent dehydrogenase